MIASKLMPRSASDMSQEEINDFCRVASAAYFAIVRAHVARTGEPALLPELLCPIGPVPCVHHYDDETLDEAEQFLLRLGLIGER